MKDTFFRIFQCYRGLPGVQKFRELFFGGTVVGRFSARGMGTWLATLLNDDVELESKWAAHLARYLSGGSKMKTVQNGVWSGIFATSAMTLGFLGFFELLREDKKSPLPPATLTSQITSIVGIDQALEKSGRENAALLSHFGYGIACALLYATVSPKIKFSPLVKGTAYGIGVWSVSYLGIIPSLGLRASARKMPAERNLLMIASHVVWGAALGFSEDRLRKWGDTMLDGHRKAPAAE